MTTKDEARKFLSDTSPEQSFWVHNGPILKNLEDLANALPGISDESFKHHVNNEKNDFSSWIRDVIGDQKLANGLSISRNKKNILKKINDRLNSLRKKAV